MSMKRSFSSLFFLSHELSEDPSSSIARRVHRVQLHQATVYQRLGTICAQVALVGQPRLAVVGSWVLLPARPPTCHSLHSSHLSMKDLGGQQGASAGHSWLGQWAGVKSGSMSGQERS